ncbi:NitT/TauT family transport system permease protein [Desulfoprunum benzoelyticum]|uniref:NitT/TauT family transport system permease protein n=1 Tax=Desulfoprunum benzoelyticum TaxID=1506996 RepID=A0A840V4J9_9BACT|nr:NitT/TauT family transport system permease protein [Desulfoprunum benzoelyticum]
MNGARGTMAGKEVLQSLLLPLAALSLWFGLSASGLAPGYLLPSPATVFDSGLNYIFGSPGDGPYAGRFAGDLAASLVRVLLGFAIAAGLGIPLGICSGRLALVNRLVASSVAGLRAVPGICWLPLALIWFGIGIKTTVFLVALAAFFPIYQNALTGARLVAPIYYQAGAMLGVSRLRGVFAILLPMAMPNIITGLRLGMGIAWAYLVLGELTGVPDGLGAVIIDARMLGQTDIILVGIILIAVIGRVCDRLLVAGLRLLFKSARRQR